MSCVRLSEGGFRVVYPFGEMGPVQSELSRSLQDMACKSHIYIFTFTGQSVELSHTKLYQK